MKSISLGAAVGLTTLILSSPVCAGSALGIASSGHTSDWNPINPRSYPALLVSRWITEHLYERKCRSRKGEIKELECQCQADYEEAREGGKVRLDLTQKQCGSKLGLPALSNADIRYTLAQIGQAPYNEYRHYDIRLNETGILQLGGGDQGIGLAQLYKFDFPLLRRQGPESDGFQGIRIDVGQIDFLNRHTGGPYLVSGIAPKSITLKARKVADAALETIQITELALELDKLDVLQRADSPDIVLAVPNAFPYPSNRYEALTSEDLASFTYIGFNFAHPTFKGDNPPRHKDLIINPEFRELFTRSLWSIDVVRDKLAIGQFQKRSPGLFLGESFDLVTGNLPDLDPPIEMKAKIRSFLGKQRLHKPLAFRMLISLEIYKHFTGAEIDGLVADLQSLWSPDGVNGLAIEPVKRGTPADFAEARDTGNYHLIFDDFQYGRNVRRQVAFVDPRNNQGKENFLGIDVFTETEINAWLKDPVNGMLGFRNAVAARYPVAVLGHFPRRDLFVKGIQKGEVKCDTANPMPFFGITRWSAP